MRQHQRRFPRAQGLDRVSAAVSPRPILAAAILAALAIQLGSCQAATTAVKTTQVTAGPLRFELPGNWALVDFSRPDWKIKVDAMREAAPALASDLERYSGEGEFLLFAFRNAPDAPSWSDSLNLAAFPIPDDMSAGDILESDKGALAESVGEEIIADIPAADGKPAGIQYGWNMLDSKGATIRVATRVYVIKLEGSYVALTFSCGDARSAAFFAEADRIIATLK